MMRNFLYNGKRIWESKPFNNGDRENNHVWNELCDDMYREQSKFRLGSDGVSGIILPIMVENGIISADQFKTYKELLGMIGVTNKCNSQSIFGNF